MAKVKTKHTRKREELKAKKGKKHAKDEQTKKGRHKNVELKDDIPVDKPDRAARRKNIKEDDGDEAPKIGNAVFGKGLKAPSKIPGFDVASTLDSIERQVGAGSTGLGGKHEGRQSTGMLTYDLILGGGLTAGWYTNFGKEQSCKSTSTMTFLAAGVSSGVPILACFDFEGSTEPTYLQNLMNTMGVEATIQDMFGIRDRNGKFIKTPRVRYISSDTAETFFDWLFQLERTLPDKIYEGGQWWFVYKNSNDNRKRLKESGDEYDKKMFTKHNKFYVPAPDGSLQALVIVDSYPAMLPERLSEDVDAGSGLGAVARMFAEQMPRVKGRMRKKRICVVGVNQLREKPMARGNPEYEPSGQAVRFYSDARMKHTARACASVPGARQMKDGPFEQEASAEYPGRKDTYRYIRVKTEKNKLSTPYLETWIRLWITDGKKHARGFDPVFDTYQYLRDTGQLKQKGLQRKDLLIQLKGNEAEKTMEWMDFKQMILGTKEEIQAICKKVKMTPCFLRKQCFKQMARGEGYDMYLAKQAGGREDEEDEGSEEETSED